jgi:hypothetical protein
MLIVFGGGGYTAKQPRIQTSLKKYKVKNGKKTKRRRPIVCVKALGSSVILNAIN